MSKSELKRQIKVKEAQLIHLRKRWAEATSRGEKVQAMSIEESGKQMKADLELLKRRLKALNMGQKNPQNPYAGIQPLTPSVRTRRQRGRKKNIDKLLSTPIVPKPYKDD